MASSGTFQAPRGMRDFYPEDMVLRNTIFDAWKESALRFGFQQYDASVVETLDLLKRKSGEEIVDQIYDFEDKSGRALALRPEMTPTLARMVAAKQGQLSFPIKWFTIAQCFRYERTTRGRKREHFQLNLDIIGEESVSAEADTLAAAIDAITAMGIGKSDFHVFYSSRALLSEILSKKNIAEEHHQATFLALDKRGKIDDEKIKVLLTEEGLDESAIAQVFELLEVKTVDDVAAIVGDDSEALASLNQFLSLAESYGIVDVLKFDISVIRGLSYYTGIVFEAFDSKGKFRAIFGGGRYDNLLGDVGGRPATGVGLGFGDVVIAEIINDMGINSEKAVSGTVAVGFMQPEQQNFAVSAAKKLRSEGKKVDLALKAEKPKAFFSRSGKGSYSHAIFVGPDDVESGTLRLKNLAERTEEEIQL